MNYELVSKPWGHYRVLYKGEKILTKQIVVNPEGKLSLQKHQHRAEIWRVDQGTGLLSLAGETRLLTKGDIVRIPKQAFHRVENTGDDLLVIFEIQTGDILSEDDIIRVDDDYGRA